MINYPQYVGIGYKTSICTQPRIKSTILFFPTLQIPFLDPILLSSIPNCIFFLNPDFWPFGLIFTSMADVDLKWPLETQGVCQMTGIECYRPR